MPTMWFAKDGPRPHSQQGPGMRITSEEAQVMIGAREAKYVGIEAPSVNPEQPTYSLKNVVLEVETTADSSPLLPKVGFYFVVGLSPLDAECLLNTHRGLA